MQFLSKNALCLKLRFLLWKIMILPRISLVTQNSENKNWIETFLIKIEAIFKQVSRRQYEKISLLPRGINWRGIISSVELFALLSLESVGKMVEGSRSRAGWAGCLGGGVDNIAHAPLLIASALIGSRWHCAKGGSSLCDRNNCSQQRPETVTKYNFRLSHNQNSKNRQ